MKISLLFSLLLLWTLFFEAQGIRLVKSFQSTADHTIQEKNEDLVIKRNDEDVTDGKCSGRNRNLMTKTTTSTSKVVTNDSLSVKSLPVSIPQDAIPTEHYPDILDIAGMDYSAAKRKPPIHN